MTKLLQQAVEKLSQLPEERQDELARMLMETAALDLQPYQLTEGERNEVEASLIEVERGAIATDEEVTAVWQRFGI